MQPCRCGSIMMLCWWWGCKWRFFSLSTNLPIYLEKAINHLVYEMSKQLWKNTNNNFATPKVMSLQCYMTKRSCKSCHLRNCNLRMFAIFGWLQLFIDYQNICNLVFCQVTRYRIRYTISFKWLTKVKIDLFYILYIYNKTYISC